MSDDSFLARGKRNVLANQLKAKGISDDRVLEAIRAIPRHLFLDSAFFHHAYQDKAFPIGRGQTISQPYTVAFQTELLSVDVGVKVLEVGTGSGYQASVLAHMGANLTTIEFIAELSHSAKKLLSTLGYTPEFIIGDGSQGYAPNAPYQRILVTAGAPVTPTALLEQLDLGGILVIPVGGQNGQKMLKYVKDTNGQVSVSEHGDFAFVPLVGKNGV